MKVCLQDCGANGWCNNGTCACELGWQPSAPGANDCAKKSTTSEAKALGMACPKKCSGRGTCDEGTCKCDPGFTGVGCEEKSCINNCNGNGKCLAGTCKCENGNPAKDLDCNVNDAVVCELCDEGFHLIGNKCEGNENYMFK